MASHCIIPTRDVLESVGDKSYDNWIACLRTYLLSRDLWDLIDSPPELIATTSTAAAAGSSSCCSSSPAWRRKNAAALHAIQISLGSDILHQIREISSAKEAWETLAGMHLKKKLPQHDQHVDADVLTEWGKPVDIAVDTNQFNNVILLHCCYSVLGFNALPGSQPVFWLRWWFSLYSLVHVIRIQDPSISSRDHSFGMMMSSSSSDDDRNSNNDEEVMSKIPIKNLNKLASIKRTRSSADDAAAGEKWMKETATSSTVVGSLIITIMFTAACTVPGGNNQEKGTPILLHDKSFKIFIASDALSLFAASTSVLMFLGILTSRYAEADFRRSLPTKLVIGLSTLFVSIAAMMVTFCATVMIVMDHRPLYVVPIVLMASVPVTLFMFLQFPLLVQIFRATHYGPHANQFDRKMKPWLLSM